jgi:hypothetical protein
MSRPLTLTAVQPGARFDLHRREAARRAELELASSLARLAGDKAVRAAGLLMTASGDTDGRTQAVTEALNALGAAYDALGEVLDEFR